MINLNEDFSFGRDTHGWKLHFWQLGKDREGKAKRHQTTTFYASLAHVAEAILDRAAGECPDMQKLLKMLGDAERGLLKQLETYK